MTAGNQSGRAADGLWARLRDALVRDVDGASLAVLRIAFGGLLMWEAVRYWQHGWIGSKFLAPGFFFSYFGLDFIQPWPGPWMVLHFVLIGAAAGLIAIGLFTRPAACAFVVLFGYVFLIDKAQYLNHFYMVILFGAILAVVPSDRVWSVAAWWRRRRGRPAPGTVPGWALLLPRLQLEVILIYAGLVKLNWDWLDLRPLGDWLRSHDELPLLGPLFQYDAVVALGAYGAIALHLIGAPLLFSRRFRLPVFVAYCGFHLLNVQLFNIGIFPWLTIAATTIMFDPDWPRRLLRRAVGRAVAAEPASDPAAPGRRRPVAIGAAVGAWVALQVLIPLRPLLFPGDVGWTEEGHRFSWRMMLRSKDGQAEFRVVDTCQDRIWEIDPAAHLSGRQVRYMETRPDMVVQFAHHLVEDDAPPELRPCLEVYADVWVQLNDQRPRRLVDPDADLARADWHMLWPDPWVCRYPDIHAGVGLLPAPPDPPGCGVLKPN